MNLDPRLLMWLIHAVVLQAAVLPSRASAAWGENWGEMVWAVGVPVPGLQPGWVAGFATALVVLSGVAFLRKSRHAATALLVVAAGLPIVAHAVTLPYSFTNGTTADADEVNANFAVLDTAVDALESQAIEVYIANGVDQVVPANSLFPAGGATHDVLCPSSEWTAIDGSWSFQAGSSDLRTRVNATSVVLRDRRLFKWENTSAVATTVRPQIICIRMAP